ncbi:MAG: CoA transferase [Pseudomonadales bacterium]
MDTLYVIRVSVPWQEVARFLGLGEFVGDEYVGPGGPQPWDTMAASFENALAGKTKYEWFAAAAKKGWTFAPVEDPFSLRKSPQALARHAFKDVEQDGERFNVPALPFKISP